MASENAASSAVRHTGVTSDGATGIGALLPESDLNVVKVVREWHSGRFGNGTCPRLSFRRCWAWCWGGRPAAPSVHL